MKGGGKIPRNIILSCRVNDDELSKIIDKSNIANMNLSVFIRATLLDKNIIYIPEVKEFLRELSHIGSNLNQLIILAHKGNINTVYLNETFNALNNIYKELTRIRR